MKKYRTRRYLTPWIIDDFHQWNDIYTYKNTKFKSNTKKSIINKDSSIATIGSCFSNEVAIAMDKLGIETSYKKINLLHYNSASIKQQFQLAFNLWPEYYNEDIWKVKGGFVHPFLDYYTIYSSAEQAQTAADKVANAYKDAFKSADVIIITLGLIECWRNRKTGNVFRNIPHPEVMDSLKPEFFRLTTTQIMTDLYDIYKIIQDNNPTTELVITTSPVPLSATFTDKDVRIANNESKSRIRAAVSEFTENHPKVNYMHSYELVMDIKNKYKFWERDYRHIHPHGVNYVVSQFLKEYSDESVKIPTINTKWMEEDIYIKEEK